MWYWPQQSVQTGVLAEVVYLFKVRKGTKPPAVSGMQANFSNRAVATPGEFRLPAHPRQSSIPRQFFPIGQCNFRNPAKQGWGIPHWE